MIPRLCDNVTQLLHYHLQHDVNFVLVIREATFQSHSIISVISGSKEVIPNLTKSIEIGCI